MRGANLPPVGIMVVSLEQAVAAPFATRQLADFGADDLRGEHPQLVYCSISGYGEDGPYTQK